MVDRAGSGVGFTVLDGVALVTGSAVALVHIRSAIPTFQGLGEWAWACVLFGWITLASAGPFIFLCRRFLARTGVRVGLGDWLWGVAGLPWLLAAIIGNGVPSREAVGGRLDPAYVACLTIGLALAAAVSVGWIAARYLLVNPAGPGVEPPASWTDRVGLVLAVAWPIQCGIGLVVMR